MKNEKKKEKKLQRGTHRDGSIFFFRNVLRNREAIEAQKIRFSAQEKKKKKKKHESEVTLKWATPNLLSTEAQNQLLDVFLRVLASDDWKKKKKTKMNKMKNGKNKETLGKMKENVEKMTKMMKMVKHDEK